MKMTLHFLLGMGVALTSQAQLINESASAQPDTAAATEIDTLFKQRKFEDALSQIEAFQRTYPDSAQASAVAEYQLVVLFERGMKKIYEGSLSKDGMQSNARMTDGKANLEQFLSLASSFKNTNYSVVQKHVLREDIWVSRMALGDEDAALKEIPVEDAAAREKFNLLRIRLSQKVEPADIERNLQLMTSFIKDFPESGSRKRVEFDMANISFPRGKQLCVEADAAEKAGDAETASAKRALASRYFEIQRSVQSRAVVDKESGIEASDIFDLRGDLLYGYFLEKKEADLSASTASIISESVPGDLNWMLAKFFDAVALLNQNKTGDATKIFDEILALDFKNKPDHDHLVIAAAKWRIHIALNAGDREKTGALIQWVREADCTKDLKAAFLKTHASIAPAQKVDSERSVQ